MSKKKSNPGDHTKKSTAVSLVRSSAAEYLTFVAASGQGGVEAVYADENVWLSQKMMGQLYDVETHTINYHLKQVFADSELQADSVLRIFRITAADGRGAENIKLGSRRMLKRSPPSSSTHSRKTNTGSC